MMSNKPAAAIALDPGLRAVTLFTPTPQAARRVLEFFSAHLNNTHTRKAYLNATRRFAQWCETRGIGQLADVQPFHVAAFINELQGQLSAPTVKQHLAALRMLFDWLVTGQVLAANPAHAVRGPRHSVKKGKTPVLAAEEARELLNSIDTSTVAGLRDRALIGLMVYTFARVGAVTRMRVSDLFVQGRRYWVRLREKGGKEHSLPCHHNLQEYLLDYVEAAGLTEAPPTPLFRSVAGRTGRLTDRPMDQPSVYLMIRRRARAADIETRIGCHTFRATGITAYLKNGGRLEIAQQMAAHESPRTTALYDRRGDDVSLDEVERILI